MNTGIGFDEENSIAIVYPAYGKQELYSQVIFSILTLYYWLEGDFSGITCVIYTDDAKAFDIISSLPIAVELLDRQIITQYKGEHNFVHRLKLCVVAAALAKYKRKVLFLDSDTYFYASPKYAINKISNDVSVMHREEYDMYDAGDFEDSIWLTIRKIIRHTIFNIAGEKVKIPFSTRMWNSGVLGVSYKNAHLIDNALALSDQLYSETPFFLAEQFAFSVILQKSTTIIPVDDCIVHYWKNYGKVLFDYHFRLFFKKHKGVPIDKMAAYACELVQNREALKMPKISLMQEFKKRARLMAVVAIRGRV